MISFSLRSMSRLALLTRLCGLGRATSWLWRPISVVDDGATRPHKGSSRLAQSRIACTIHGCTTTRRCPIVFKSMAMSLSMGTTVFRRDQPRTGASGCLLGARTRLSISSIGSMWERRSGFCLNSATKLPDCPQNDRVIGQKVKKLFDKTHNCLVRPNIWIVLVGVGLSFAAGCTYSGHSTPTIDKKVRGLIYLIMIHPEYQMK